MTSLTRIGIPRPGILRSAGISRRAVVLGLALAVLINIWVPFGSFILQSSRMTVGHLPISVLIPFFFLLFIVNPALRTWRPTWVLTGNELALVFVMMFVSSLVPGKVLVAYLMGVIATPYYFARPENQWAVTFFEYLPDWLLVSGQGNTLVWFYEGIPEGAGDVIWGPWLPPLFWWLTFFVMLFFMGACMSTIMRRTWVAHERLTFPLVRMAVDLIRHDDRTERTFPGFAYDRLFQMGFGLTLALMIWNIAAFWGAISPIPIGALYRTTMILVEGTDAIRVSVNIYALCFAFLAPLEITFSLWFFALCGVLEGGLLDRVGLQFSDSPVGVNAVVKAQFFGGFIVFVFWHLWTARAQIADVFRQALRGGEQPPTELMSYRVAVLGLAGSVVYLVAWLVGSGLSWQVVPVFLFFLFVLYLGTARIIAQTGLAFLDLPVNAHHFTILTLGSGNIDHQSLTTLGLGSAYARNWRGMGIGTIAQSDKVMSDLRQDKRGILALMIATFVISLLTSVLYTVYIGNTTVGAYNFGERDAFGGINETYYDDIVRWIRNASQLQPPEFLFMALGGVIMLVMTALTYRFPGWPLAPVGFTVAFADVTRLLMFSLFLAWLIKMLLLRIGGVTFYRRAQPFAWGVLVGYTTGVFLGFVVDWIWFPGQGHALHEWT
ncbi:MAG: hypothetical protein F4X08_01750 [Gemmatimonadetes bacterium]|nr:hypothetical protein [Gemmatimonadota bacterium]MYD24526.1 hypothetical protein [Gemmatimonadota bacterium]MYJ00694.1 hypothetical protein [Gemmatimonadota bacterium]